MSNTPTSTDFYCDFIDAVADLGFGPADFDTDGILPSWVENRYDAVNLTSKGNVVGLVIEDTEAGSVTVYHLTNNGLIIDEAHVNGEHVLAMIKALWQVWQ